MILTALAVFATTAAASSGAAVVASIPVIGGAIAVGTASLGAGVSTVTTTVLAAKGITDAVVIGSIAGGASTTGINLVALEVAKEGSKRLINE